MDHVNRLSATDKSNVGEEEFIWIRFTNIVLSDDDGVCLIGVSCVELYELTNHTSIVTRCHYTVVMGSQYNCYAQYCIILGILAVPS